MILKKWIWYGKYKMHVFVNITFSKIILLYILAFHEQTCMFIPETKFLGERMEHVIWSMKY